jgi:hypothetical protein
MNGTEQNTQNVSHINITEFKRSGTKGSGKVCLLSIRLETTLRHSAGLRVLHLQNPLRNSVRNVWGTPCLSPPQLLSSFHYTSIFKQREAGLPPKEN